MRKPLERYLGLEYPALVEIFLGDYYDLSNGVWRISQ